MSEQQHQEIAIIMLAAGASSRMMSADKLLEKIDDIPLLRHATTQALTSRAQTVIVVLRPRDGERRACLHGTKARLVKNPDWQNGMASSIATGLRACPPSITAAVIALADMPDIKSQDYNCLIDTFKASSEESIIRASSQSGRHGHPVLFPRRYFPALQGLHGDRGAKEILHKHADQVIAVCLHADSALTDLDTPEDWQAYRQRQPDN